MNDYPKDIPVEEMGNLENYLEKRRFDLMKQIEIESRNIPRMENQTEILDEDDIIKDITKKLNRFPDTWSIHG